VVRLFGKYKFMQAVPYLIDSLDATSMNIGAAALESLLDIFPGPNPPDQGLAAQEEHFKRLYQEYLARQGRMQTNADK